MTTLLEKTTLRAASDSDVAVLNALMRASKGHWEYDVDFLDSFMERYTLTPAYTQKALVVLMEEAGTVCGFYGFGLEDDAPTLDYFFIHPSFIGNGLGRLLWQDCVAKAKIKGWESFTFISDPDAEPFYERMGAQKIGDWKSSLAEDRYCPIMEYTA
tara:strand:+ start:31111 stop:31581 length:471 start_codon:yes stop_codon:yes gene_type:complete